MWKPFGIFWIFFVLVSGTPVAGQVEEKGRYRLGLYLEKKDGDRDGDVLNAATDAFITANRFILVARNQLEAVFTEKDLQEFLGGQANHKLADALGLDLLGVIGYTTEGPSHFPGKGTTNWTIDVRLVDVRTAVFQATVTSHRTNRVAATPREAGKFLYQSIREAFPPLGYVVKVNGKDVIIDLGSEAGLQKGDILEVVQTGPPIRHPIKNSPVTAPMEVIGELKVVATSAQSAACKVRSAARDIRGTHLVRLKSERPRVLRWVFVLQNVKK